MKLSSYERGIALVIVESLIEYGLLDYLDDNSTIENWFDDKELFEADFEVYSGVTKACIIHSDLDWVIKVGFNGYKLDYAAREYENYCLAEEAGLEYYFPTTIYLGDFGGHAFYVQEMAQCDEGQVVSEWYERLRDSYEEDGEHYDEEHLWDEVYELEDERKALLLFQDGELYEFLNDRRINDLHEGNFGYIGGKIVIIDFSGYMN